MLSRAEFLVNRVLRSIWFRPAAYAAGAAFTVFLTPILDPFMPFEWEELISAQTNEAVLTILASSLLAVAIFSLSTMVSALQSASSSATPRARHIPQRTARRRRGRPLGGSVWSSSPHL